MGLSLFIITLLLLSRCVHCENGPVLQCIVNQDKCMTCLWNQQGFPRENYSLYYWYSANGHSDPAPCPQYLLDSDINIGCWFNTSHVETFTKFYAKLNNSDQEYTIEYPNLQNLVKLDPPYNLHVENTSSLELLLKWEPSLGSFKLHCVGYQVQHRNLASDSWTVKDVSTTQFSLPSYDPLQTYTFQVRSILNNMCSSATTWSEWSAEVTWGRNATTISDGQTYYVLHLMIYLTSSFVLVMLLILLIRMERIWVIFVPQIPNPGKNFEDLFSMHEGNFQEWLGVSKELVESFKNNYTEPLCSVSEDVECNGVDVKNPTSTCPPNQPPG